MASPVIFRPDIGSVEVIEDMERFWIVALEKVFPPVHVFVEFKSVEPAACQLGATLPLEVYTCPRVPPVPLATSISALFTVIDATVTIGELREFCIFTVWVLVNVMTGEALVLKTMAFEALFVKPLDGVGTPTPAKS